MAGSESDDSSSRRKLVQDVRRLRDVEVKQERVRQLLKERGADGLLLQEPANIAWFTAGADLSRCASDSCLTSVFVTEDARLFATNSVDSALVFEREAFGLGFQLKQREWFQPHHLLIEDLCRGRKVISDSGCDGTQGARQQLASLRLPLTSLEIRRLRRLTKVVVHAVEAAARNVRCGVTEAAVAGEVSHRLLKRTVTPVRIQVCADGRNRRYRHWSFGEDQVAEYASISCVARRWGLHVGVTRTLCLNELPDELWKAHQCAAMVHATGMFFSQCHQQIRDVWPKVQRIYDKFGMENEWQLADQADVLGYRTSEVRFLPDSDFLLAPPVSVFWHPSVGPAMMGDTVLVTQAGTERLTVSPAGWPEIKVRVKGVEVPCAGILRVRDIDANAPSAKEKQSASLFSEIALSDDPHDMARMDSIWEMDVASDRSVFEDHDAPYSEESVLD
jgi:Metallopeptidase family M24